MEDSYKELGKEIAGEKVKVDETQFEGTVTYTSKIVNRVISILAITMASFQLYTAFFGTYKTGVVHNSLHLAFAFIIYFLLYPLRKKGKAARPAMIDISFSLIGLFSAGYVVIFFDEIASRVGFGFTFWDIFFGGILILVVLEAARRTNAVFTGLAVVSILYALWGHNLPGIFRHAQFDLERLIYLQSFSQEGILGVILSVSATYLFLFILFGAFLNKSNAGKFFIDGGFALVGRFTGGPAKATVITDAAFGTVTGSGLVSVVTTGVFTIPLMKRVGFKPEVAAAVECDTSMGSQFMPPVMGVAAFIMAELTGIAYGKICVAALLPAFIYFFSFFLSIHIYATKNNLKGLKKEELPRLRYVLRDYGHLAIPIAVLVWALMFRGYTATKAGTLAIVTLVVVGMVRKTTRMGVKEILSAMEEGTKNALPIIILCACVGIVIGNLIVTGLAFRFTEIVVAWGGASIFLTLILAAIVSIILGMGMPSQAAYLIMAIFAAPAIVKIGVPILAAHLFVFYFAVFSGITPPVAMVAVCAAGVANTKWWKVSFSAMRLGIIGFILPFYWIYDPALLMEGHWIEIFKVMFFVCMGTIALVGGIYGYLLKPNSLWERGLFLISAAILLFPQTPLLDILGLGLFIGLILYQWKIRKAQLTTKTI